MYSLLFHFRPVLASSIVRIITLGPKAEGFFLLFVNGGAVLYGYDSTCETSLTPTDVGVDFFPLATLYAISGFPFLSYLYNKDVKMSGN